MKINGVTIPKASVIAGYIMSLSAMDQLCAWEYAWEMYMKLADLVKADRLLFEDLHREALICLGAKWGARGVLEVRMGHILVKEA